MKSTPRFEEGGLTAWLGSLTDAIDSAFGRFEKNRILDRIWKGDHRVWKETPSEIANRLGWIQSPLKMAPRVSEIRDFAESVRAKGYDTAILLGMGGSSLAPEVFRLIYGTKKDFLDLIVLDSTDPDAVSDLAARLQPTRTLFIVATKSGSTVETLSFMKYFYALISRELGSETAGRHFTAITDPGSRLEKLADELGFLKVFLNDPDIGGRYSALSCFGLVPAALIGLDIESVLSHAISLANPRDRTSSYLGVALGEAASLGKDKLTLILSPSIEPFGAWVEQLIAESLGKEGKGVLPVVGEPLVSPSAYGDDRLFVHVRLRGMDPYDSRLAALTDAGHPVLRIDLQSLEALSGEFFRWMMATAAAGAHMGINPFDQPNVEAAKILARKMISSYLETGKLPSPSPDFEEEGIQVYFQKGFGRIREAFERFFGDIRKTGKETGYVAIHAYVKPGPETDGALGRLRLRIRERYRVAVTAGYGPRFLHSTGQLHKGDSGHGLFIQLTSDSRNDQTIPDETDTASGAVTFGILKSAQALGDRQALLDAGRSVIRFHLARRVDEGISRLIEAI